MNINAQSVILSGEGDLLPAGLDCAADWLCPLSASPIDNCQLTIVNSIRAGQYADLTVLAETPKIDAVRALGEDAIVRPFAGERKAFVVCGADNMLLPAQNAFLMLLEEPPRYLRIILLCRDAEKLLPTIRSRCAHHVVTGSASAPTPAVLADAEQFAEACLDDWKRMTVVYGWEKKKRDELAAVLDAVCPLLRTRAAGDARVVPILRNVLAVRETLPQNASVGIACGCLAR